MVDTQMQMPKKTSFIRSTWEGIKGSFKGTIVGALIGAVLVGSLAMLGTFIPGAGEAFAAATQGTLFAEMGTTLGLGAMGAAAGAQALGTIGGLAGAVTGVVRSREANQPSAEDVINVAKISFAQGVAVGHQMEHAHHHKHDKSKMKSFEEKLKIQRAAQMNETQITH